MGRYLETKPADLGARCVLFETFGRCPYGVTCRFAGAHLGPGGQNLVREELAARWAHRQPVRNGLDKALQQQLRKRKIRFQRAELALRQLSQGQLPGPSPAGAVPEATGAVPEATGAVPEATAAEGTPGQSDCDAQQAPAGPDAGCPPGHPVQTCGPLTDEDVVRLRPCEKKRVCAPAPCTRLLGTSRVTLVLDARARCPGGAPAVLSPGPSLRQPQHGGQERRGWAEGATRRAAERRGS